MEDGGKITKEMLCDESRFILANVMAESKYGRQSTVQDIQMICKDSISIPFGDYLAFLVSAGFLRQNHQTNTLKVTGRGEEVVNGGNLEELKKSAVSHFKSAQEQRRSGAASPDDRRSRPSIPPPAPSTLETLGYKKETEIGSGGIGTVYRGKQLSLGRNVAIKELRELFSLFSPSQRSEITQRFTDVVCKAAQITHPNILAVHDIQTSCEYPFVVTELCTNGSVRRLISDASVIPVNLSLKYLIQTLHALKAAHSTGLIHKGLKPENLLLDEYGNLRVSDFNFSKIVERDQHVIKQVFVGMGSVGYMAPELFHDPKLANVQSDIYAAGIIFYEMLTRKIPGRRSKLPSQIDSRIPTAIDDIFDNMTHDEVSQRYSSIDDILSDFEKIEDFGDLIGSQTQILQLEDPLAELEFSGSEDGTDDSSKADGAESAIGNSGKSSKGTKKKTRRPYSYQQRNKKS